MKKVTGKQYFIYRLTVNGVTGYLPVINLPVIFPIHMDIVKIFLYDRDNGTLFSYITSKIPTP